MIFYPRFAGLDKVRVFLDYGKEQFLTFFLSETVNKAAT